MPYFAQIDAMYLQCLAIHSYRDYSITCTEVSNHRCFLPQKFLACHAVLLPSSITKIFGLIQAVHVVFDGTTKRVKSITNKLSNISMNVDQGFYWYNSSDGHNVNSSQTSGAYVFRYKILFSYPFSV